MATEFTIFTVPKGTETSNMPHDGLEKAEIIFNERHPDLVYYKLLANVRSSTKCKDDYVKVPKELYPLLEYLVDTFEDDKDYVISCD